ncbi:DUF4031 domain-containing protein [Nesterenkonia sp.]|uniref:DUF4031 domain-containing protein n=1 Tax=Nesterenkonia sp. TaxID=704201 RepID=UPI00260852A6|nr:DUF4031 domain-containing protein [Nesterenkonia sp.]
MTIYIDPPVWPAHGTVFSHVISSASLEELHAFARSAGLSERAFDRDHYDAPAHRYQELVDAGAVPVAGSQLVRVLADSGLRIRSRERPEKLQRGLQRRWARLGPEKGPAAQRWEEIGRRLLQCWSEPHRSYHALPHLGSVLRVCANLERDGELPAPLRRPVLLAGWFHDAVYRGEAGADEEVSARLAEDLLDGLLGSAEVAETARLVRLTAHHSTEEDDAAGSVLVDADLEVLGRDWPDYRRYTEQVRQDYAHVPDDQFAAGRAAVLRRLLGTSQLYRTRTARQLWQAKACRNMERELAQLQDQAGPA